MKTSTRVCVALIFSLSAGVAWAAENEVIRADTLGDDARARPASSEQSETEIQLFGHQAGEPGGKSATPVPESKHELRRPEASATAAPLSTPAGEGKVIDRRGGPTSAWKFAEFLPLAAVLAVIAVVGLIIRRVMPAKILAGNPAGLLEIVARTPIAPKQSVILVRVAKRFLLLGVSPESVNTLCIVDDSESSAELMTDIASRRPDSSSRAFESSFNVETGEYEEEEEPTEGAVRGLLQKVRRLGRTRVA